MKKLLWGVLGVILLCGAAVFTKLARENAPPDSVGLFEIELKTVNETASASGHLTARNEESYFPGCPSEITEVCVSPGDRVDPGDPLFRYKSLTDGALGQLSKDGLLSASGKVRDTDPGDILAAAEYYASNGTLPLWFRDFYLPALPLEDTEKSSGTVCSGISGTVTEVNILRGDPVSGIFPSVTVTGEGNLIARIEIPQEYLGQIEAGQHVNLTCSAFEGEVFSATVTSVSDRAKTVGGLLTTERTVVEGELELDGPEEKLIPGLSVRADIFVNVWSDAAVIPYSALCTDEKGESSVWVWKDGAVSSRQVEPVYCYSRGAVTVGVFREGELVVTDPPEGLLEGTEISGRVTP